MKIHAMIDARYFAQARALGRYSLELVSALLQSDGELRLSLLLPRTLANFSFLPEVWRREAQRLSLIPLHFEQEGLWTRYQLSQSLSFEGIDLYHSLYDFLPRQLPVPSLFTVHNLLWLLESPKVSSMRYQWWRSVCQAPFYRSVLAHSRAEAAAIIASSEQLKSELYEHDEALDVPVFVSSMGVSSIFLERFDSANNARIDALLQQPYVLMVGQLVPYRNHEVALAAFLQAFEKRQDIKIAIVSEDELSSIRSLRSSLKRLKERKQIYCFQQLNERELAALYQHARLLLMPSLYEGFALPMLEAMASGCPVLTTNYGAMAELAGDAAAQVDPYDIDSMAEQMRAIIDNPAYADALRQAGRQRSASYRWSHCAKEVLDAYRYVLRQ